MKEFNRQYWENMYEMPLEDIPWEIKDAPAELREAVEENKTPHGRALDAGCGTGNYSIFLAKNGYSVIGVDYSEEALAIARANNEEKYRLPVEYIRADLASIGQTFDPSSFDLILDYRVLHHLPDETVRQYADQCTELLKPKGKMIIIVNSEKDTDAQGGESAVGQFGNVMHYRTRNELLTLFPNLFEVSYKEVMLGKKQNHAGHCLVLGKS